MKKLNILKKISTILITSSLFNSYILASDPITPSLPKVDEPEFENREVQRPTYIQIFIELGKEFELFQSKRKLGEFVCGNREIHNKMANFIFELRRSIVETISPRGKDNYMRNMNQISNKDLLLQLFLFTKENFGENIPDNLFLNILKNILYC